MNTAEIVSPEKFLRRRSGYIAKAMKRGDICHNRIHKKRQNRIDLANRLAGITKSTEICAF